MYHDFLGREIEDAEMDAYYEDQREARKNAQSEWTDEEVQSHDTWLASQEQAPAHDTYLEIVRLGWPTGETLVTELIYHLDQAGQLLPNSKWTEQERAALQALIDYRKPREQPGRGNSLEVMSEEETALHHALSLALLTPAQRQEYDTLTLVNETHLPIALQSDFCLADTERLEDGTVLVTIYETGPNWTTRTTLYILALTPEISVLQAYSPWGELSFNHRFYAQQWAPDDSHEYYDFPAVIARMWEDCPGWLASQG